MFLQNHDGSTDSTLLIVFVAVLDIKNGIFPTLYKNEGNHSTEKHASVANVVETYAGEQHQQGEVESVVEELANEGLISLYTHYPRMYAFSMDI